MPLKELFKREKINTLVAESAGRSLDDLLLYSAHVGSSLEITRRPLASSPSWKDLPRPEDYVRT